MMQVALAKSLVSLIRFLVFAGFLSASLTAQATDEDEGWAMLQKAAVAARVLSYQGVFVCQTSEQIKSVQITHHYDGRKAFSRNVVLDGAPREVLGQNGDLLIYDQRNEKIVIERRYGQNMFPAVLPLSLDAVKASYILEVGGLDRVAGRQAQILSLIPKDDLRYGYKFWVDTEIGLLLKSVMINNRDEIMERFAFNQLSLLKTVALDWFKPNIDRNKSYVMERPQVVVPDDVELDEWIIKELPMGYRKVNQVVRMVPNKPYPLTHIVFSDGLASVSLFIEAIPKGAKVKGVLNTNGNTSFYANVNSGHLVTVLGEVPEATVVQIANAVVFKK